MWSSTAAAWLGSGCGDGSAAPCHEKVQESSQSRFLLSRGAGFGQTSANKALFEHIAAFSPVASCLSLDVFLGGRLGSLEEAVGGCEYPSPPDISRSTRFPTRE